eukprot:g4964.t1
MPVRDALLRLQSLLWPSLSPCESADWWASVEAEASEPAHRHGRHHHGALCRFLAGLLFFLLRGARWIWNQEVKKSHELMQASEDEAGMLFGLTQDGKVFFHAEQNDTAFIQLRGEPCFAGCVHPLTCRGGNVIQLDADDDAMWGLDGDGSILWRPAGDVGKHSRRAWSTPVGVGGGRLDGTVHIGSQRTDGHGRLGKPTENLAS